MAKNLVLGQILVQMRAAIFYFFILFYFFSKIWLRRQLS